MLRPCAASAQKVVRAIREGNRGIPGFRAQRSIRRREVQALHPGYDRPLQTQKDHFGFSFSDAELMQ